MLEGGITSSKGRERDKAVASLLQLLRQGEKLNFFILPSATEVILLNSGLVATHYMKQNFMSISLFGQRETQSQIFFSVTLTTYFETYLLLLLNKPCFKYSEISLTLPILFLPLCIFKHIIPTNPQARKLSLFLMALWHTPAWRALHLCWPPGLLPLLHAKAGAGGCSKVRMGGTVQMYCVGISREERVRGHTNQQLSFSHPLGPRGHQRQGAGARMRQTGCGSSWDKRLQAWRALSREPACIQGRQGECVSEGSTNGCKADKPHQAWEIPVSWKQCKHHVCLPCFSSSLGT